MNDMVLAVLPASDQGWTHALRVGTVDRVEVLIRVVATSLQILEAHLVVAQGWRE